MFHCPLFPGILNFHLRLPSLTYRFRRVFFNFHMFADFPVVFLLLISSLILLWLENSLCLILTFKVLLRFVSWVMHDLSLVNILRLLKNKNSAVVGWSDILASTIISLQKCG